MTIVREYSHMGQRSQVGERMVVLLHSDTFTFLVKVCFSEKEEQGGKFLYFLADSTYENDPLADKTR